MNETVFLLGGPAALIRAWNRWCRPWARWGWAGHARQACGARRAPRCRRRRRSRATSTPGPPGTRCRSSSLPGRTASECTCCTERLRNSYMTLIDLKLKIIIKYRLKIFNNHNYFVSDFLCK